MPEIADVIVIGSGPSGAQAAKQVLAEGFSVALLDFGNHNANFTSSVPDRPFSVLRESDEGQRSYFLGDLTADKLKDVQVGAHLAPPREFITRDVEMLLPFDSQNFHPLQSLALGGLGAGWGAGVFTYEKDELLRAGLPPDEMRTCYDAASADVGISGSYDDDIARYALEVNDVQPPLDVDSNAESILRTYEHAKPALNARHFVLGRAPLAVLSQPLQNNGIRREANPYFDMDFYGDSRRSVYRPRYSIEEMQQNGRFKYIGGAFVKTVRDDGDGRASVSFYSGPARSHETLRARTVLIAAGALNTARIVLRSLGAYGARTPLLSNPYHYIPCINMRQFGRPANDRRYSLCQLVGIAKPDHRNAENVTAAIYSYRSLLAYKLVKEIPLPPALGLLTVRALATSLTIAGVHHPDSHSEGKWLALERRGEGDTLTANYEVTKVEADLIRQDLAEIRRSLRLLGVMPFDCINPGWGSSIHYAGTVPSDGAASVARTDGNGRLVGTENVYLADSSGWNYLPAKGLTFTLMANARRIAKVACRNLREQRVG